MNQGSVKMSAGKTIAGIAVGLALALIAPLFLIVEAFMPVALVMLPSVALVALYRWAGRAPALSSAGMMLAFAALFGGAGYMLIVLAVMVLPTMVLLRMENRPFFFQLRAAIAAFGAGMLVALGVLYMSFGGNMIERVLGQLPEMVRALPEEYIAPMLDTLSNAMGRALTTESFYELYDEMVAALIEVYQLQAPQRLFSGALISAMLCAWLSNRMRARRGEAAPGSYAPLRAWVLPASTTGGVLLLVAASWLLDLLNVRGAETAYYAAYGIACVAFSAQTLGSAARRLRTTSLRPGGQRALLAVIGILGYLWLPDAMLVYGGASAIFGSRGVLQQRAQNRQDGGRFGGEE